MEGEMIQMYKDKAVPVEKYVTVALLITNSR